MARVSNARSSHIERWVVPTAREILIRESCKDAPTKLLEDVALLVMGQSPAGETVNEDGDGTPFIGGPSDLGIEFPNTKRFTTTPTKLCKQDDIIVCVRATIGEPRWSDGVYSLGRGVAGIRPKSSDVDRKFLFRIVQANERLLYEQGTGTTFKTITKEHLAKIIVPILPMKTQKAIGDFIAWLDGHISESPDFSTAPELPEFLQPSLTTIKKVESLAARIAKAQSLREESLQESDVLIYNALRQVFDPQKIQNHVDLETTCVAIIDNLHSNPDYSGDCLVPCIRSSDVGWGELFLHTARKTSEKEYQRRTVRGEPSENDIVLVREGGGTGKAALVGKNQRFSLGQRVMMLRPNPEIVLPKFLLFQLMSPHIFEEQILPRAKGSASPHLNIGSLRKFKFLLPPLDEQRRIVAYLDSVQARLASLRELQSATGEELSALLPSVLDKAFKGEL